MKNVQIKILDERIGKEACYPLPTRATDGSAAIDLRACIKESELVVKAGEAVLVGTGLSFYIKNPDYVGLILPRSGLGHKSGIVLGNLVGVIDADYQGELKISLWNRSKEDFTVKAGDRIAQYMIVPIVRPEFEIVSDFDDASARGAGGFGSTGKQ
ncbi:dUTP diphosphatase [uncultured Psychrobacter sp.]|uniref:dUTP diphosphatase n=1 Tax=uncultured Psychrobacter sp. TaxID=259303 RepID=UPI0030DC26B1